MSSTKLSFTKWPRAADQTTLTTMNDYDDLDAYNGDSEHDMWVDFDYNENTGELPELFEESDTDEYIDNLNDWD